MNKLIKITVDKDIIDGQSFLTMREDSSGHTDTRGGDLLRAEDTIFVPAFGKYVRDLARKYSDATMTFEVISK